MPATATPSDEELVQNCLATGTDAFSEIVTRYQSLICALTYNATGCVARSEDLAQEVFLTAWKELRQLREPAKLRSWLCGIARRRIAKTFDRETREPACAAELLVDEHHTPEADPAGQAISREEEAILWRTLEQIPETYREPLILFYREGQSPEEIAAALDLTEEAARQRLSRGRKMLQARVAQFVETMLRQTTPGRAFTVAVMLSLPPASKATAAATIGMATIKGGAAGKGFTLLGMLGTLFGPVVGALSFWNLLRGTQESAQCQGERRFIRLQLIILLPLAFLLILGISRFKPRLHDFWDSHPLTAILLHVGLPICIVPAQRAAARWAQRRTMQIRAKQAATIDPVKIAQRAAAFSTYEYKSAWTLLGLPLLHVRSGHRLGEKIRPAIGWIAIGDQAVGLLVAVGGFTFGGISVGAVSCGVVSIGVLSAGVLAYGAMVSLGLWGAMGNTAVGYLAHGTGNALAWHAATGARAMAHDFAQGLHAFAAHANDPAAHTALASLSFFKISGFLVEHNLWGAIAWVPGIYYLWQIRRVRHALRQSAEAKTSGVAL